MSKQPNGIQLLRQTNRNKASQPQPRSSPDSDCAEHSGIDQRLQTTGWAPRGQGPVEL
uniref:Uncharacterized protein n=1 Tax=Arundo donax TaxID=35708 RepID=A0A0A9EJ31_ARUDO